MDEQERRALHAVAEFELAQLERAEQAVEAATVKVERQKNHLDAAKQSLHEAKENLRGAKERSRDAGAAVKNVPNADSAGDSVQAHAETAEIASEGF